SLVEAPSRKLDGDLPLLKHVSHSCAPPQRRRTETGAERDLSCRLVFEPDEATLEIRRIHLVERDEVRRGRVMSVVGDEHPQRGEDARRDGHHDLGYRAGLRKKGCMQWAGTTEGNERQVS